MTTAEEREALARDLAQAQGRRPPPAWAQQIALPRVTVGGEPLPADASAGLVEALRLSAPGAPHPLLTRAAALADRESLEGLAWALARGWAAHRAPASGRWAMRSLGLVGGDGTVRRLAEAAQEWRAQGRRNLVAAALEALAAIGSDAAVRALFGFADQRRYPSLRDRSAALLDAAAAERGVSRRQLEDLAAPRFGLGGALWIGGGERALAPALDDGLAPALRDRAGRLRRAPPRGGWGEAEAAQWRSARAEMRAEVARLTDRLERSMVDGHRWTVPEWEATMLGHPLWRALARHALWGGYDEAGELRDVFCLTDDMTLANEAYATVCQRQYAAVGLPHPAGVPAARRARWADLLHDFQVAPLFPQAARLVCDLSEAERAATALSRLDARLLRRTALAALRRRGWWHFHERYELGATHVACLRRFPRQGVTAVARVVRRSGDAAAVAEQRIAGITFVAGEHDTRTVEGQEPLALGAVAPVAVSEALRDVSEQLAA